VDFTDANISSTNLLNVAIPFITSVESSAIYYFEGDVDGALTCCFNNIWLAGLDSDN